MIDVAARWAGEARRGAPFGHDVLPACRCERPVAEPPYVIVDVVMSFDMQTNRGTNFYTGCSCRQMPARKNTMAKTKDACKTCFLDKP